MSLNILEHIALTYQPVWGRDRQLAGVRLHVRALHPDSVDVGHFLNLLSNEWTERSPFVLVAFADPRQLSQALALSPVEHVWLELPSAQEKVPASLPDSIGRAYRAGHALVQNLAWSNSRLPARPGSPQWRYLVDLSTAPVNQPLWPAQLYLDVPTVGLAKQCLDEAQAWGVCGWPDADALAPYNRYGAPLDKRTLVRVQQALMRDAAMDVVEDLIQQDPILTFRTLKLVNSPLYGTSRKVETVRQALLLLGLLRVRDWLMELLPGASTDPDLQPVRQAMVVRARLMTQLMNAGEQHDLRTDIYMTGLFSRLHHLMHEPLGVALGRVPLSAPVAEAILRGTGPYAAYLELARGMEHTGELDKLPAYCEQHGFGLDQVNRSLIRMFAQWHNLL